MNAKQIKIKNDKLIKEFEKVLIEQQLTKKIIEKHLDNIDFFINDYLLYYDDLFETKDGICSIDDFLGSWFISKAMWASKDSINSNIASMKKFYTFLKNINEINENDFKDLLLTIKQNKKNWIENLEEYDSY